MPDETRTEATCSDATGVDNSLFGEASDTPTTGAVEQETKGETYTGDRRVSAPRIRQWRNRRVPTHRARPQRSRRV